ncbi:hypothetical protein J6590_007325 [Homalodisca vitripennis]|nr:hypothetical protein J6590_007325 [Homalodisca vitripennis]
MALLINPTVTTGIVGHYAQLRSPCSAGDDLLQPDTPASLVKCNSSRRNRNSRYVIVRPSIPEAEADKYKIQQKCPQGHWIQSAEIFIWRSEKGCKKVREDTTSQGNKV